MTRAEPTFYERNAFKDDFRRKWREDQGRVSIFDKRQKYKLANARIKSATEERASRNKKVQYTTYHAKTKGFFMGVKGSSATITSKPSQGKRN